MGRLFLCIGGWVANRITFTLGGATFGSKRVLRTAIRQELAPYPFYQEFSSYLLSDLISKHHYACAPLGLLPTLFKKIPIVEARFGYELQAYFPERGAWHDVSWHKAVDPPTFDRQVTLFFRLRFAEMRPRIIKGLCEVCGATEKLEVDHVCPTFKDIVTNASAFFTPEENDNWAGHNWWDNRRFSLPDSHLVVRYFDEMHAIAKFRTVCQGCHRGH